MSAITTVYLHGYTGERGGLIPIADQLGFEPSVLINMPGFGGTPDAPPECRHDITSYSQCVWSKIREKVPTGPLRLIGHSHGAMVAFTLAHLYPAEVDSIVLLCPVAQPQWPARLFVKSLRTSSAIMKPERITNIIAKQRLVDAVSKYSMQSHWSDETRQAIFENRRQEAKYYRPSMIDMFTQTLNFTKHMGSIHIKTPTIICYATDDNVAGKRDAVWYQSRCSNNRMVPIRGGHLVVVAEPAYVADVLRPII